MDRIGRERGWPPLSGRTFDAGRTRGAPTSSAARQEVAEKILFQHELFGHHRFLLQFSVGTLPHRGGHAVDRALRHKSGTFGKKRTRDGGNPLNQVGRFTE